MGAGLGSAGTKLFGPLVSLSTPYVSKSHFPSLMNCHHWPSLNSCHGQQWDVLNLIRVKIIFNIINALTVTTTINFLRRSTVANFRHFPDQCSVHGSKERPLAFPQLFIPLPQLPRKQQVRKITQKVQINRELKEWKVEQRSKTERFHNLSFYLLLNLTPAGSLFHQPAGL